MTKAVLALLVLTITGGAMSPARTTAMSTLSDLLTTAGQARWQVEDLGPQVFSVTVLGGAFGIGPDGKAVVYAGLMGEPAQLAIMDPDTGARLKVIDVEGAGGFYDMLMATDGNLYLASHPNGFFFRYRPGSDRVENLGKPSGGTTFIWELAEGADGRIYGGCYPQARLFEFDPATETMKDLGPAVEGEDYVRCLLFHPERRKLYAGVGSHAALLEIDPATGEKRGILPEKYRSQHFVYALGRAGGDRLVVRLDPSDRSLVLNLETGEVDAEIPGLTSNSASDPAPDGSTYYTGAGTLMKYEPGRGQARPVGGNRFDVGGRAFRWTPSGDGGTSELQVLLTNGQVLHYSPEKDQIRIVETDVPRQAIHIHNIARGPDGKIYSSGYVVGNLGVYDPSTGAHHQIKAVKQAEGITVWGSRLYFGTYPRAHISVLDTARSVGKGNPSQIFTLEKEDQDRPFGMLAVPEHNRLFVGTVPGYGLLGGVLAEYDAGTGDLEVHRDVIPGQSIVALAYRDGILFGGTTIHGGLGVEPTEKEGKLFLWDVKKGNKVFDTVPVPGKRGVSALRFGPDGNLWGWAEGTLFIFDPKERRVIYADEKLSTETPPRHFWRGGFMSEPDGGSFYGMLYGNLYRLDAATRTLEVMARGADLELLARDEAGHLYFVKKDRLMRLVPRR